MPVSNSLGFTFRDDKVESCGNSVLSFLRNFHSDFQSGRTNIYSHQQCIMVQLSLFLIFLFRKLRYW